MSDNVFSAFGKGFVAFAHTRAADLVGDSFSDTGKLVISLADGQTGTTKTAFDELKQDIEALTDLGQKLKAAIDKEINDGKAAVLEMAAELGRSPFEADELARALTALGKLLVAYDAAITKVADKISEKAAGTMTAEQIKADINGMNAPIKKVLNDAGGAVTTNFDKLCKFVLNVDDASSGLGDRLVWNYGQKRLQAEIVAAGAAGSGPLNFDGARLIAFFTYQTEFKAGLEIKTKLKTGLRAPKDPANPAKANLLDKIMPGQPPTADTDQVAVTLDTKDGLTFGSGKDKRLVLPVRFSWPGLELREFAVEQPAQDNEKGRNRVNIVFTVAGKLGDVFACVVEGGGITIRWNDGADPTILPKIPSGAGLRLKTPAVTGGGYLRYDEVKEEYGGVFQLSIGAGSAKFAITAIGLLGFKPSFNMVIVIGVQFSPKIELGFGFTLSGLGGILAIERALDSDALRDGLKDGVVGQLLFPADPVAAAPQILNQLGKIFPFRSGGFVIGPMAELGWGSQTGFVKARLGIVLSLPDPKVVILGHLQVGVPSADVEPAKRVVNLNAELMAEINPDYFFLKVSLTNSKLFTLTVTGDMALYIQWAGEGAFVLSVGGFFPGYEAPKQIGTLQRVGIRFAPPVDWLSVSVQAYVAITSNTVQFGGRVAVVAKVGPAKAEGWLQIDALFQWAPHFHFDIRFDAGIRVSVFDQTLAGVTFKGELSGDKPFRLEGHGAVEILWWDVPIDVGPLEWGDRPPPPAIEVDPMAAAAQALTADAAWVPVLPPDAQGMMRLAPAAAAGDGAQDKAVMYHPLGRIEARQIAIPLETDIDRVGSGRATRRRINLRNVTLGGQPAGAVWPLNDRFPPGHFLNLKDQEILARPEYEDHVSGLGIGPERGATFSAAINAGVAWNTICPDEADAPATIGGWNIAGLSATVLAMSGKGLRRPSNPYLPLGPRPEKVALTPRGTGLVVSAETLAPAAVEGLSGMFMTASQAGAAVARARDAGQSLTTLSAGFV